MRRLSQLYFHFAERVDRQLNSRVHSVARQLIQSPVTGVTDVIPGYTSLHIEYDAAMVAASRLTQIVRSGMSGTAGPITEGRTVEVPTVYDGPDLADLAKAAGLTPAEAIRRHADTEYLSYAVGFTPGFAFLGDVHESIRRPRLGKPRAVVPAGSVGIADAQTGVYPLDSPGGWNLVGRAVTPIYDPHRAQPYLIEPGDLVRFVPVPTGDPLPPLLPLNLLPLEPRFPAFKVHKPGLLDLVVDRGRYMVGRLGFARSGPLDAVSARIANALLANPPDAPLLEMNVLGPTLEATRDVVIAVTGAGVSFHVDGRPASPYTTTLVKRGQVLTFPPAKHGTRGYLAIAGGIDSELFLGSASVDVRGLVGRPLQAGDVLAVRTLAQPRSGFSFLPYRRDSKILKVRLLPGPQFDADTMAALASKPLRIEHSDRMGVRLSTSPAIGRGVVSEGNPLGAVQLTADGQPLILLNDRGTMGGYTKPAVVDPRDLPRLAQARDGTEVRFVVSPKL